VTRRTSNWKEVGGAEAPILLVGREKNDPLLASLRDRYPFFDNARFDKIIKDEGETENFLNSPDGAHAIAFGAMPNFKVYNHLPVKAFAATIAVGLAYDKKKA